MSSTLASLLFAALARHGSESILPGQDAMLISPFPHLHPQVELSTNHGSLTRIMDRLRKLDYRVRPSPSLFIPCPY